MTEHYKTVCISANYAEIKKKRTDRVKVGTRTVQKRKGMFSGEMVDVEEDVFEDREVWYGTGKYYDTRIDMADLARRIQETCNQYWDAGYELVQTIDTIEGRYNYEAKTGAQGTWGYGYGYGYSITDGVVLLFRKRTPQPAGG